MTGDSKNTFHLLCDGTYKCVKYFIKKNESKKNKKITFFSTYSRNIWVGFSVIIFISPIYICKVL